MRSSFISRRSFLHTAAGTVAARCLPGATDVERILSPAEVEQFLVEAEIVSHKTIGMGVTRSIRATLSHAGLVHGAHIQSVDESKAIFQTDRGTELNFRDCWMFNVAVYRLDAMLGLNMTPPSVKRKWAGKQCAFTWWIDDTMLEGERRKKKLSPPDVAGFNRQMHCVRVMDQWIQNSDRTLQNLLVGHDWKLWMIDHTRCFRLRKQIAEPKDLVQCDRRLLSSLHALERRNVVERMEDYLRPIEVDALMARRDLIVRFFEGKAVAEGEDKVLFDMPARAAAYAVKMAKAA